MPRHRQHTKHVYRGVPAKVAEPKSDRRTGQQGLTSCGHCHVVLDAVRASFSDPEVGIVNGKTVLVPRHVTGGTGTVTRGKVPCFGSDRPAVLIDESEL